MAKLKKNTKKKLQRAGILAAVFIAALFGYFVWNFFNAEKEYTVYTSMEEPTLPVVYAQMYGSYANCLHGYLQDMGNEAATDCITILPEDRKLSLRINEYNNMVANISYEIRSLDLSHYIESTEVKDFERRDGFLYATLPVQNLIEKDCQYLLRIKLDTGEKIINYYTKIMWTDSQNPLEMLAFSDNFTRLTFNYEQAAKELVTYLEAGAMETNDDLGTVNIKSNFSQLTWAGTGMKLTTDLDIKLKEYDGIMSVVEVGYMTERTNSLGNRERYQVKDSFTMRKGAQRIYLLNYERKTNQIFEGTKQLFTGKRILLGITNKEMLQTLKSEDERYIAFKANRELWSYDQQKKKAVNVFSFRSGTDDGVRANYDKHDIKILSVSNNGDIDFVVYGYMNRGRHEGYNGIAYYQYSRADDTVTESFFIPLAKPFENIKLELDILCKTNDNDMLYILQNNALRAIELKSGEMLDLASGLTDESYAVSSDQSMLAWVDGGEAGAAKRIQLMDLDTGGTKTVEAPEGEYLRLIGFMENDLIIGCCRSSDIRSLHGEDKSIPMYKLSIRDENLSELKSYEKENTYIENVRTDGARIHLDRLQKTGENEYYLSGTDTIVYKEGEENEAIPGIDSSVSEDRKRVYYVSLSEEIKNTRSLRISVPGKISYENSDSIELIDSQEGAGDDFYAYTGGRLVGKSSDFMKALDMCYDGIGYVIAGDKSIVYNRADKLGKAEINNPAKEAELMTENLPSFTGSGVYGDEIIMLSAQGMNINQALYYVYKGMPVIIRTDAEGGYRLICGYDEFNNIRIYDPEANDTVLMGEAEAAAYFESMQNDFICGVRIVK